MAMRVHQHAYAAPAHQAAGTFGLAASYHQHTVGASRGPDDPGGSNGGGPLAGGPAQAAVEVEGTPLMGVEVVTPPVEGGEVAVAPMAVAVDTTAQGVVEEVVGVRTLRQMRAKMEMTRGVVSG